MQKTKIEEIPDILERELPTIIKKIAQDYNISPYIENPDFLEQRLCKWHQFGLLTHTKKVREVFLKEIPILLKNWGLNSLENLHHKSLFEASILLHDLGKIIVYENKNTIRQHEIRSKDLIYQDFLNNKLNSLGLSKEHIDYIGRCVETHYILGKRCRDELSYADNLKLDYISEKNIGKMCKDLSEEYPDIKIELGIFYLCDCLGKTDIRINANTDYEIIQQEQKITDILKERNLHSKLKKAVMQLPVNIKIAEVYLKNLT